MKNSIRKINKFVTDHKYELVAITCTTATLAAVALTLVVVSKKLDEGMLESARDFIESKGLENEFLGYIVEN